MLPAELRQRNLSSASYTHAHKNDRGGASDRNERARNPMIHDTKLLCASQEGNSQQSPAPSATKTDHATSNSFVHVNTDQLQLVLQTVMTPQERRIKQQTNWSHTNKKCQKKQKKRNRCACMHQHLLLLKPRGEGQRKASCNRTRSCQPYCIPSQADNLSDPSNPFHHTGCNSLRIPAHPKMSSPRTWTFMLSP